MFIHGRFGLGPIIAIFTTVPFIGIVDSFVLFEIIFTFSGIVTIGLVAFEIPLCFMARSVNGYASFA